MDREAIKKMLEDVVTGELVKSSEAMEKEAKEKAEKEAKEKAEKEAKEKAEKEAKEKAEKEAKEKAEKEDGSEVAKQLSSVVETLKNISGRLDAIESEKAEKATAEKAKKDREDMIKTLTPSIIERVTKELGLEKNSPKGKILEGELTDELINEFTKTASEEGEDAADDNKMSGHFGKNGNELTVKQYKARKNLAEHIGQHIQKATAKQFGGADE